MGMKDHVCPSLSLMLLFSLSNFSIFNLFIVKEAVLWPHACWKTKTEGCCHRPLGWRWPEDTLIRVNKEQRDVLGGGQLVSSRSYRITGIFSVEITGSRSRSNISRMRFLKESQQLSMSLSLRGKDLCVGKRGALPQRSDGSQKSVIRVEMSSYIII